MLKCYFVVIFYLFGLYLWTSVSISDGALTCSAKYTKILFLLFEYAVTLSTNGQVLSGKLNV